MKLPILFITWLLAMLGIAVLPAAPETGNGGGSTSTTTTTVPWYAPAAAPTVPTTVAPEYQRHVRGCEDVVRLAIRVGWPPETLAHLARIAWRESACTSWAFNPKDPKGGSYGVLQINGAHLERTAWRPQGWLQSQNIGVNNAADLFVAELNLRAGLALYHFAQQHYGDGWQPWNATRDKD